MVLAALAAGLALLLVAVGAQGRGGGVGVPDPPRLNDAFCIDRCAGLRKATEGSRIELDGKNLKLVRRVSFAGPGNDRAYTKALKTTDNSVVAKVPDGAESGRPSVRASTGTSSSPEEIEIVGKGQIPAAGSFKLEEAKASPDKAYFDGARPATLHFSFKGGKKVDVRVDIVSARNGSLVDSMIRRDAKPFVDNAVSWNGKTSDGKSAPSGRYQFEVGPLRGGAGQGSKQTRFGLFSHEFPVRANHTYGDGFGDGRNHQGQDVFARCGSKLVVARGGKVTFNKFQSAAGNYVVIDGKADRHDYMYAHLRSRSPLKVGKQVKTGQLLGYVGQTGDATGCHLHFEFWQAPWQQGGEALASVTRMLKKWDGWS